MPKEISPIHSIIQQFKYYKMLGDKSFEQLGDEGLFWQFNSESNSIAIIVNHLHGNMLSRWTDFLTIDGEKEWRNRDSEFEDILHTRKDVLSKWEEGWSCLFHACDTITLENIDTIVYIRNQGHTIREALERQLAHYAHHVGQIVYIARMICGPKWKSLSIPKGNSISYNEAKFSKEKSRGHYTDEFLKS